MKKIKAAFKTNGRTAPVLILAILMAALANGACDVSGSGGEEETKTTKGESEKAKTITIMTWNVQALFDGTEDGNEYEEYRESADWSKEKYQGRLNAIAGAIGGLEPAPPDIIAMQEIESERVLGDLVSVLSKYGYSWSHFAQNPNMALGLGILSRLPLSETRVHSVNVDGDTTPRPVLETRVSLVTSTDRSEANGGSPLVGSTSNAAESLALFICHWKSKLGGEDTTEAVRRAGARSILRRIRELAKQEPELPVIVMGDLNENHDEFYRRSGSMVSALLPDDSSSANITGLHEIDGKDPDAGLKVSELQQDFFIISKNKPPVTHNFPSQATALYSPWGQELQNGSYYYKNAWETIDHFLLSEQLFNERGWEFETSSVVDSQPFANNSGHPAAYNPRTGAGLSDHLPLLLILRMQRGTSAAGTASSSHR